jgi:hypothetical protein
MFNTYNNQSLRKLVVAFGSLFDEIYVTRKNDTTGAEENIKVPITFSSKEKFLRRLESNSSITDKVKTQLNLPYMSFEMVNVTYDRGRKRNKLKVASNFNSSTEITSKTFSETPIEVEFRLYFYSRSLEEILQILEQILPSFNPEFNIRMNFNDVFSNINVPISYGSFRLLDDYEGNLGSRRILIGTMQFNASSFIFNEVKSGNPPTTTTLNITSLFQGDEDVVEEIQSIVINEDLPNSFYNIPDANLNNKLTWVESGNFSENTQVIFLREDTQEEIIQFSCPVGGQTISGSQYAELEQAIVTNRGLCGSAIVSGFFMYRMIVTNGNTTASQSFIIITITGSAIC